MDRFKAKVSKELAGQISALDVGQYVGDPRYKSACALARVDEPSEHERQDDSEDNSDDASTRGRNASPMKPSTRRKARYVHHCETCIPEFISKQANFIGI